MFRAEQICVIAKHARCCYAKKVAKMAQLKCIGDNEWIELFKELKLFKMYLRFLDRYEVGNDCTTEEDLNAVINATGKLCGVCYTPENVQVEHFWLLQENGAPIHFEDPASADDDRPLSYLFN